MTGRVRRAELNKAGRGGWELVGLRVVIAYQEGQAGIACLKLRKQLPKSTEADRLGTSNFVCATGYRRARFFGALGSSTASFAAHRPNR